MMLSGSLSLYTSFQHLLLSSAYVKGKGGVSCYYNAYRIYYDSVYIYYAKLMSYKQAIVEFMLYSSLETSF